MKLEYIWKTFRPVFDYARRIVDGYSPTGIGGDPRPGGDRHWHRHLVAPDPSQLGWPNWDNLVWYFENVMQCQAVHISKDKQHIVFSYACTEFHGGLLKVYERLGVSPAVDVDLVAPLAMKLCWETGLNTETLLKLKRDCPHESHPLTGLPYIRYYKARSTGEKDLHLGLFDGNAIMPLQHKQSVVIKRTIELILKLTDSLVSGASDEEKPYLFLYKSCHASKTSKFHRVVRLTVGSFCGWTRRFLRKARKKHNDSIPIVLNLGRFRPSRITQLVREGKDFFEIQAVAGHTSAATTLHYIQSHQIAPQARREVSIALQRIQQNAREFEETPKPYATQETLQKEDVIYKAVLCDCKDIYSPPLSVRRLPTYNEGQPSTYFNMCLTCPNVLFVKRHLPRLLSYQREIRAALSTSIK